LHASTRFPLVGRHVAVACGKCHDQQPPGVRRVDWQLAKTACADCHQNPIALGSVTADNVTLSGILRAASVTASRSSPPTRSASPLTMPVD
jgi:hypothetical protein